MRTVLWREGKVEVEVPDPSLYPPSADAPVFFNPRAKLSRDLSTLILKVLKPPQVIDAMAGTGIRGIRYAVEAGIEDVVFNDINPRAMELIQRNLQRYGIEAEVIQEDVNLLLQRRRFVAIDLDPFGSPSPFLSSLGRSVTHRGVVLVTATDTSPLAGSSPLSAVRKYHSVVRKLPWFREMAVRVLLGYVQHTLMVWEKAMLPVFSFFEEHHIRVIGTVVKKPSAVTEAAKQIKIVEEVGPLWTGRLHDREVLAETIKHWDEDYGRRALKVLQLASEEVNVVGYYHIHLLSKQLGVSPPSVNKVINELRSLGYRASRSSLEPKGVKTDAPEEVVKEVILRSSSPTWKPTGRP
ncbi:MAG: methyltransferase [Candidatus Diapherotrites archaeon]|nr:methyltransferase [Candidatus Diapherotrites archaeon]